MNNSDFFYSVSRNMYRYRNFSRLHPKLRTLARNIKLAMKSPGQYSKKAGSLILKNPRKLLQIAAGTRTIQNVTKEQKQLMDDYQTWINEHEKAKLEKHVLSGGKKLVKQPLVSLITPVFDPPVGAHNKLIESVMSQTYENFELLLFNFGAKPEIRKLLDSWAAKDKRIIVKHGLPNGGISNNSNLCLEYVKGEFVGLLDHDDALMPHALYECVKAINETEAEFVYSDKDKITEADVRHEPLFKPEWSPEMALAGNYMTHFNLMKTELVRKLGGWDAETDGAQDWDLFLRILDHTDKVAHVPEILYHWRTVAGSTANNVNVKPYALEAQRKAVNKHLKRQGLKAFAQQDETGQMYIHWEPAAPPSLFLVHVLFNDWKNTAKLVNKIKKQPDYDARSKILILAEKGSATKEIRKEFAALFAAHELHEYIRGGLIEKVHTVVQQAPYEIIMYVTDSVKNLTNQVPNVACLSQITAWLSISDVAIASGGAYAENGQIVDIGSFYNPDIKTFEKFYFSTGFRSGYAGHAAWIRNLILVGERFFAFQASLFAAKDIKSFYAARDDELAKVLALINYRDGGRAVFDPAVRIIDKAPFCLSLSPSETVGAFLNTQCRQLELGDPYYNPNLNGDYIDPRPGKRRDYASNEAHIALRSIELPYY